MKWKNIKNLIHDTRTKLIPQLPRDISAVYAVPRSGSIPAFVIASYFSIPMGFVGTGAMAGNRISKQTKTGPILIIDDSLNKGTAIKQAQLLMEYEKNTILTAVVYCKDVNLHLVDFYAECIEDQRVFEWNLFDCRKTNRTIFDIDGVLCLDPPMRDNDGLDYQNYVKNATPYLIPQRKVYSLCTSRLERWRGITEEWLQKYNVTYKELIMHPAKNAKQRRKLKNGNVLKAEYYKQSKAKLFVESRDKHAKEIATLSNKPVISIQSMEIFT
jgi:uncharacterized HAD superfamily protein